MTDQLFVGQLQQKVEELKTEYDLQRSIKDNTINAKIQRSRDKICEILRRVQGRRQKPPTEQSYISEEPSMVLEEKPYQSKFNEEVLQRRHYIFQFKMYLRRKRERQLREQEFKLLRLLDSQTESLQRWVTKDSNDFEMFDFFYSQIDPNRKGQVHHLKVKTFMFDNPLIMSLFQFDRESLSLALDSYLVKERFHFSHEEFIGFLQKYQKVKPEKGFKQYVHLFDPTYQSVNLMENTPRIMLLQNSQQMRVAFDTVSENGMAIIDNVIKQIRQDCNLFENAVHIVNLGLNLLLESLLQLIEIEYINTPDQMISWNQFLFYFDNLPDGKESEQQEQRISVSNSSMSSDDYFYEMIKKTEVEEVVIEQKVKRVSPQRKPLIEVNVDRMTITVPKPLEYEKREKDRSPGIRERWVMEQVRQKQEEIEEAYKFKPFKAKPIPFKVKDKNYYNELLEREEIRRRELKDHCKEKTLLTQKPFKFEERKKEKIIPEESETIYKFRANPIPWYCSLKMYERNIMEQKIKSDNRKKIRKFWLSENSKLPPRMQEWVDKQIIQQQEKLLERPKSASPKRTKARSIPDFKKLYDKFQHQMDKKKKSQKSTVPVGPKFHESKKCVSRDYLDEKPINRIDPVKKAHKVVTSKPKIQPRSTEKFNAYVDRIQEKKWNEIAQLEQQYIDQQQREEKKQLFLPRVQQSWAIADHRQMHQERQQQKFVEVYQKRQQEEEDFNNMMKEIFVRVYQRPLLMEVESMKCQPSPQEDQGEQEQFDYMNPIGEQEVEESERISQQDPDGVDQVGEQAEQSLKEYDGQEIDGEYGDEIDIDNIDPQLLDQLQRDALGNNAILMLANQYGLSKEEIDYQMQKMENSGYEEEEEEEEEQDEDEHPKYLRHSF